MVTSKSVEKNNEEWYNKTVQIFERSYRTDASFVISHIKSAQKKFTCQGYLITAAKGKPLKVFSGESEAIEKQLQNSKIPYFLLPFQTYPGEDFPALYGKSSLHGLPYHPCHGS